MADKQKQQQQQPPKPAVKGALTAEKKQQLQQQSQQLQLSLQHQIQQHLRLEELLQQQHQPPFKITGFRWQMWNLTSSEEWGNVVSWEYDPNNHFLLMHGRAWWAPKGADGYAYLWATPASVSTEVAVCGSKMERFNSTSTQYQGDEFQWGAQEGEAKTVAWFRHAENDNYFHVKAYRSENAVPMCGIYQENHLVYGTDTGGTKTTVGRVRSYPNAMAFAIAEDKVSRIEVIRAEWDRDTKLVSEAPLMTKEQTVFNRLDDTQTSTIEWVQEVSDTKTIQHNWSIKLGYSKKISASIKVLDIGGTAVESTFTFEVGYGGNHSATTTVKRTIGVKDPVRVPPHSGIHYSATIWNGRLDITGKLTLRVAYQSGACVDVDKPVSYSNVDCLKVLQHYKPIRLPSAANELATVQVYHREESTASSYQCTGVQQCD